MKKLSGIALFILLSLILTGCSIDRAESLQHPETALPNEEISVVLTNIYSYLNNTRTVQYGNVARDSVHLLIRVPEGYEIYGAKSYVISDFSFNRLIDQLSGDGINNSLLQSYLNKLEPMVRNESLDSRFKGNTFKAFNVRDRASSISVNTDEGTWIGYSAKIDIKIKNGDKLDTIFAFDSVKNLVAQFGIDTSSLDLDSILAGSPIPLKIDSIAITSFPILIQTTLRTSGNQGLDTVYYYTKTAKLPVPSHKNLSSNGELGSMMFAQLNVNSTLASKHNRFPLNNTATFKAYPNPFTKTVRLFSSVSNRSVTFSIYSVTGNLINQVKATQSGFAEWNGTDMNGSPVQSGRYIVRTDNHAQSIPLVINLVR